LPRKGFRFLGDVREVGDPQSALANLGEQDTETHPALPLPDRPSIAVLPFVNLSANPEHAYFADGIVEDIITELSRFSDLFVIARNSSFQYKGRSVDVRQVGRELGVSYVLEGSIRRDGRRVRINAQLINAVTGTHRWAERYDRKLHEIYAVQDELIRTIVAILAAHVNQAEIERILLKAPATWETYDYYMRALASLNSFWSSFKIEDLQESQRLLECSVAMDATYARAFGMLSATYMMAWLIPLDEAYLNPDALDRAYQLASKAVQLDPNLPMAQGALGFALLFKRQHDASLAAFEKAIAVNPNYSDFRFALALLGAGEPARALEIIKAHMRVDPFYLPVVPLWSGMAHYLLCKYAEALPLLRECVARAPDFLSGHAWLAATYAQMGQLDAARAEAAEVLRIEPKFTINGTSRRRAVWLKSPADAEHHFDGLLKAGLPEK
jgi:adenylate cyclase